MKSTIAAITLLSSATTLVSAHEDGWGGWGWWPAPEPGPESGKSGKGSSGKSGKDEPEPEPWGAWGGGDVWNGGWEDDGWGWAAPEPEGKSGRGSGKSGKDEEEKSDDAGWGWGHPDWDGWGAWPELEPEGKSGKGSKGSGKSGKGSSKSGKGEGEKGGYWVFVPAWPTDDGWSALESEGKSGKGWSGKSGKGWSGKSGKGEEPEPWAAPADETTTYIISFKDKGQSPTKRCESLAKSNRGTVKYVYEHVLNGCSLSVPVGDAPAACNAFKNHPTVSMVEEDQMVSVDPIEGHIMHPHRMLQVQVPSWGLDRINQCARPLDNVVTKQDASGVTVFIIDTGINAAHTEFANGVISSEDCHASFIGGNALNDDEGHGTHVAGTACGANYGVSSNCKLCAVKVLDATRTGPWSGIIAGIDYVTGKCQALGGLCVANVSIGGGKDSMVNAAVNAAVNAGVVMVVSAGNENRDACSRSPASEPSAITVGSTMNTDNDARSLFSNWGSCVDVYAPGSDITSSWISSPDATNTMSGTSMASPHVTGIAAAIRSANPSWNPTRVRDAIVNSAALPSLSPGINLAVVDDIDCQQLPVAKAGKSSSLRNRHV